MLCVGLMEIVEWLKIWNVSMVHCRCQGEGKSWLDDTPTGRVVRRWFG